MNTLPKTNALIDALTQAEAIAIVESLGLSLTEYCGSYYATTLQVADFYGVSTSLCSVRASQSRQTLHMDGMKQVGGDRLQALKRLFNLPPNTPRAYLWSPKAIVRLSVMMPRSLRASEVLLCVKGGGRANTEAPVTADTPDGQDKPTAEEDMSDMILVESRSARAACMADVSDEKANARLQAQGLVMALWRGDRVATTAQMAEFYQVPADTIKSVLRYHREEFESDGLKTLRGKALSEVRLKFNLSPNTPRTNLWTPRAALRLGLLLTGSEVAKAVRTVTLDLAESVPQRSQPAPEPEQPPTQPVRQATLEEIEKASAMLGQVYGPGYQQRMMRANLSIHFPHLALPAVAIDEMPSLNSAQATLIPTDIARELGLYGKNGNPSARAANKLLERYGYQVLIAGQWNPTDKALEHCDRRPVITGGKTDRDQLRWYPSIVDLLRDEMAR